jgi:hypothetical protein
VAAGDCSASPERKGSQHQLPTLVLLPVTTSAIVIVLARVSNRQTKVAGRKNSQALHPAVKVEKNKKGKHRGTYNRAAEARGNLVAAKLHIFESVAEVVGGTTFSENGMLAGQSFLRNASRTSARNRRAFAVCSWQCPVGHLEWVLLITPRA